jgi:hypothetical protein
MTPWTSPHQHAVAPPGLPLLDRGKHQSPAHGAGLMEYVSVLAGRRFTDRPRCTHPVLAQLARGINDHLSDDGRDQLIHRAPDLAVLGRRTFGVTAAVTDAVLDTCAALDPQHQDRWHHRARRLRGPATTTRPWLPRRCTNLAATALVCCGVLSVVEGVADQHTARRDQALLGMLDRALNTLRPAADTSPGSSVRKLGDPRGRGQRSREAAP